MADQLTFQCKIINYYSLRVDDHRSSHFKNLVFLSHQLTVGSIPGFMSVKHASLEWKEFRLRSRDTDRRNVPRQSMMGYDHIFPTLNSTDYNVLDIYPWTAGTDFMMPLSSVYRHRPAGLFHTAWPGSSIQLAAGLNIIVFLFLDCRWTLPSLCTPFQHWKG